MERKCPCCTTTLLDNCYIKDTGASVASLLTLIVKDKDLKKKEYELKASYCPTCGHVETWIETEEKENV